MDVDGDKGYKINGENEGDHFGSALAVGDVNGDGYPGVLLDLALYVRSLAFISLPTDDGCLLGLENNFMAIPPVWLRRLHHQCP